MDELMAQKEKDILYFTDTVKLMRKYMEKHRPQSFASLYRSFIRLYELVKLYGYKDEDVQDILDYADKENICRFKF